MLLQPLTVALRLCIFYNYDERQVNNIMPPNDRLRGHPRGDGVFTRRHNKFYSSDSNQPRPPGEEFLHHALFEGLGFGKAGF